MSVPRHDCETVRPMLFALVEGGLGRRERSLVDLHLVACAACRDDLVAETALTGLLGRPRRRLRRVLPSLAAAAALLLLVGLVVHLGRSEEAHGAVSPSRLGLDLAPVEGEESPLASSNHFAVPTGERRTIVVAGTGTVDVAGPAVLELDRTPAGWKLALLHGGLRAEVDAGSTLRVATMLGLGVLGEGVHEIQAGAPPVAGALGGSASSLISQGHAAFSREDFATAERSFRAALEHPDATGAERTQAGFYLSAALGRQEKYEEAVRVDEVWLKENPDDKSRHYVLFFHGIYHQRLGNAEAAKEAWETILREAPESSLAEHARFHLAGGAPAPAKPVEYSGRRLLPVAPEGGVKCIVVTVALRSREHAIFAKIAGDAAKFHGAALSSWDGKDEAKLARILARRPERILFVVPPEVLDTNLHRRVLLHSTKLDEDVFPDVAWGWLTARDGKALAALWERTKALHGKGLSSTTWLSTAVTSGPRCSTSERSIPAIARVAGFEGARIYYAFPDLDPKAWSFVDSALARLETAGVITMTGNGDPEGIWLFDDARNADRSKHWPYDPAKVGHDPDGSMPRIMAARFRALKLRSPVVWSGTCHSAAVGRVFVEGDIVSTFGRTDGTTVHLLPPEKSLALAILDGGAAAFLAPLGANHGMSVSREVDFALENGATLGETVKSTWDDVCLAALENLRLDLPEEGTPHRSTEPVMQGGGANRALLGDPSLRPFEATPHPLEKVEITARRKDGFDVLVTWKPGFHPRGWDMFGLDRARDGRVYARVLVDGLVPADRAVRITATLEAADAAGKPLPYVLTRAEPEVFAGKRYLHLQANASRKAVGRDVEVRARFSVTFE